MPEIITQEEIRREHELLADLGKFEHGQALLSATKRELDRVRRELELRPVIDNSDLKRDFRFQLGLIEGLQRTLRRPDEAQRLIKGG